MQLKRAICFIAISILSISAYSANYQSVETDSTWKFYYFDENLNFDFPQNPYEQKSNEIRSALGISKSGTMMRVMRVKVPYASEDTSQMMSSYKKGMDRLNSTLINPVIRESISVVVDSSFAGYFSGKNDIRGQEYQNKTLIFIRDSLEYSLSFTNIRPEKLNSDFERFLKNLRFKGSNVDDLSMLIPENRYPGKWIFIGLLLAVVLILFGAKKRKTK